MLDGAAMSALDWWLEAGVDTLVDEQPRDWLAPIAPAVVSAAPADAAAPKALPNTLAAFRHWLLHEAELPGSVSARVDAAGDHAAGTVIVIDMPEDGDRAAGALLSGEVGALFNRMLAAIKLSREALYLLPFSPARPTVGRLNQADIATLTPLLLHHLALAQPKRLLLLGDAPAYALLQRPAARAREAVHKVEIGGHDVPAVVSIHPRLVNNRRDYRQHAWSDLQRFAEL
jgi:uracil-DNA glycosylase